MVPKAPALSSRVIKCQAARLIQRGETVKYDTLEVTRETKTTYGREDLSLGQIQSVFESADVDGDPGLSPDELSDALTRLDMRILPGIHMADILRAIYFDQDGDIQLEEFVHLLYREDLTENMPQAEDVADVILLPDTITPEVRSTPYNPGGKTVGEKFPEVERHEVTVEEMWTQDRGRKEDSLIVNVMIQTQLPSAVEYLMNLKKFKDELDVAFNPERRNSNFDNKKRDLVSHDHKDENSRLRRFGKEVDEHFKQIEFVGCMTERMININAWAGLEHLVPSTRAEKRQTANQRAKDIKEADDILRQKL